MKFYIHAHQKKETAFVDTLSKEYEQVAQMRDADICFYDHDAIVGSDRFAKMQELFPKPRPYFVFPHAGRPSVIGDIYPVSKLTSAQFVSAQGHVDVMRAYGYDKPLAVTGWHLTPVLDFRPFVGTVPRVLFAPVHPRMSEVDRIMNGKVHRILLQLARRKEIVLTVRYIRSLIDSGIKSGDGANYCEGSQDSGYDQILQHDLVVATHTYAYMSVALGTPTLMMDEDVVPRNFSTASHRDVMVYAHSWNKYRDMMMFPYDILRTGAPMGLIQEAMSSDAKIADWKRRMIGDEFRGEVVLDTVKSYLDKH